MNKLQNFFKKETQPVLESGEKTSGWNNLLERIFLAMPIQDQIIFAKRLSILIQSGMPIVTALGILHDQAGSKGSARIIEYLRGRVEEGRPLSDGMERYRRIFGDFAVSIVRVGEVSGTLDQSLLYLADELKKKQALQRNVASAMVYPAFIFVATIAIVVFLTAYMFPKIVPIFASFKAQLPWSTRLLIAVSAALQHYWAYIALAVLMLIVGVSLLLQLLPVRLWVDRNSLRLPLIGPMMRSYSLANMTRTFGLLLQREMGIIQALKIARGATGNAAYRMALSGIIDNASRGERISKGMEHDRLLFPPVVSQMVAVGEVSGHLNSSLRYLAEMHEEETALAAKNLSAGVEPLLMIIMGLLVGFIAISIITPIYGITQSFRP